MALEAGSTFAGYQIERRLGTGGMGAVYLAKHPRLPRRDALKVLDAGLGADKSFRIRFEREAELTARLDHPNIVSIRDRGIEGDQLWISMQFIDGTDAAGLIQQGPAVLPPARAVNIVAEAAKGLDYAHRHGLLHRDVKPANLLISTDDEGDKVVVTDFGIARTLDDNTALTSTGSFLATIAYAAPELIEGRTIDHRIDVYALGCTLFEMLTGSVPFARPNPVAMMHAHITAPAPHPSEKNRAVPPALDLVIERAMAKDPADRFQTCRDFANAARAALTGVAPRPTPPPTAVRNFTPPPTQTRPPTASGPHPAPSGPHPAPSGPHAAASGPHPAPSGPHSPPSGPQRPPSEPHRAPSGPQPQPQATSQPQQVPPSQPRISAPQQFAPTGATAVGTPPSRSGPSKNVIIMALSTLAAVILVVVVAVALSGGDKKSPTPSKSDEEQVEDAIRTFAITVHDKGFTAAAKLACADSRANIEKQIEEGKLEGDAGVYMIVIEEVKDIIVDRNRATADVTSQVSKTGETADSTTDSEILEREDGQWKICDPPT